MEDSIFTKIVKKQIPCHKIYEDSATLAFLDIHPISEGHTLVIPKNQIEFVWDIEDKQYIELMQTVKKVAKRLREVLPVKYIGMQVVGEDVPHAHIHLVPFNKVSEFRNIPDMSLNPDNKKLAELAKKLAF